MRDAERRDQERDAAQPAIWRQSANAIRRLVGDGYLDAILMSQDVFLKMLLTRYGGFGYGYAAGRIARPRDAPISAIGSPFTPGAHSPKP